MTRIARIAAMCLFTAGSWAAAANPPLAVASISQPLAVFPFNEESIAQMRQQHPLVSAEVEDPVYHRKRRYQGFWLRDVLKDLTVGRRSEADLYVRFRCKDGYLPTMPLARAMGGKGLIAIREANAPQGKDWQPLPGSGISSTPAPSYLVWVSPPGDPEEYPWPYQMVAIEIVSSSDVLADRGPEGSKRGRELFVVHCLKCHAINGVGGDARAGTEFSLQRNGILESAPSEAIHYKGEQYSNRNKDAEFRFAAADGHPVHCRISSIHGRPQEARLGVPIRDSLFGSQRFGRIHARRALRRDPRGGDCRNGKDQNCKGDSGRV